MAENRDRAERIRELQTKIVELMNELREQAAEAAPAPLDLIKSYMCDHGGVIDVPLWYPDVAGNARQLQIELYDVRAADDLRIGYDKDRDGWVVLRPDPTDLDEFDDPRWKEVAFTAARPFEDAD